MSDFNYLNIETAYEKIKHLLVKTPLISNDYINQLLEAKIYFKLENLQKTGSFKHRGATYKISKLSKEQKLKLKILANIRQKLFCMIPKKK